MEEQERLEKFSEYLSSNRYYMNELYTELETFMQEQRKAYQVEKDGDYKPQEQIFPNFNIDKAIHANKLIDWLTQFKEIKS